MLMTVSGQVLKQEPQATQADSSVIITGWYPFSFSLSGDSCSSFLGQALTQSSQPLQSSSLIENLTMFLPLFK